VPADQSADEVCSEAPRLAAVKEDVGFGGGALCAGTNTHAAYDLPCLSNSASYLKSNSLVHFGFVRLAS
jgi:hypothetical protein